VAELGQMKYIQYVPDESMSQLKIESIYRNLSNPQATSTLTHQM
jgi:ribonucleotide reductase beta subunit family protein with ferritin-like domain